MRISISRKYFPWVFTLALGLSLYYAPSQSANADDQPGQIEVGPTKLIGPPPTIEAEGLAIGESPGRPESSPLPTPPAVGTSFEGFGFDDNSTETGFLAIPPDPHGAAGTDRLIAVVNRMIEARTKSGTLICRDSLRDFFATAPGTLGTLAFDPKVVYDQYAGRFVVVALELVDAASNPNPGNMSRILLAVSRTASPGCGATDWRFLGINSEISIGGSDFWADYPGFEVDEEAVYITANMFTHISRTFGGVRLWIVGKGVGSSGFYDGGPATVTVHNPYAGGGSAMTTMPCQVYGPGGVGPGIGTFLVSYSNFTTGGPAASEFVQVVRVDNPLGAPTFTRESVNVGDIENVGGSFGFPDLPDAPQSGTSVGIEVNDSRALDCVWRDGEVWLTTTIRPNSGPDAGQTTAHWFQLNAAAVINSASSAGLITLAQQGNIGGEDIAPNTYTFFPSVAVNSQGEAQFGFSASASSIFAGAFVTGRQPTDPAGTVQASATVHAGEDAYVRTFGGPRNRWGDYSGISLDPTDDNLFWVFNQFANQRGTPSGGEDGRWGTAWGSNVPPPQTFTLTVTKQGIGSGTVTGLGISCGSDCSESYTSGTVVNLTAAPVSGSTFAGWSENPDCSDGSVTMNAAKTCTATFNVASTSTITVTSPNGGEVWPIGSTQAIRWNASGFSGTVKIQLSRNNGASWINLFGSTANDKVQNWKVTAPATTQALIRICSVSTPSLCDTSNAVFTLGGGSITVTVPNGGETWLIGSTQTISWNWSGISGTVKIQISRNNGASWTTLFGSTANDKVQNWKVTGPATTQGRIRISSVTDPSIVDTSNGNFTIP